MTLRYEHHSGHYIGERLSVPESTFVHALQQLLTTGCEPNDALERLLDESVWSPGKHGVALLEENPRCRFCRAALPRPRRMFCGAVCEAASYVEARLCSG